MAGTFRKAMDGPWDLNPRLSYHSYGSGASATQISKLSEVKVNGGATAGPNQSEVLLDIELLEPTT